MSDSSQKRSVSPTAQREVIAIPIEENFISLRCLSPQRVRFGIEYGLERGTTANSFLFTVNNSVHNNHLQAILVHPPGETFREIFLDALSKSLPNHNAEFLVVVGHINPNRVALIKQMSTIYSKMKIVCSNPGAKLFRSIWSQQKQSNPENIQNTDFSIPPLPEIRIIKESETISIGENYRLKLIPAATARWPGGLLAFEENLGLLMSDKFFAAHLCTKEWAEANRSSTDEERRHYFDCLMTSMAGQVDLLVERLEELDIRSIAPGHGPAIEGSWRSLLNDYRRWGEDRQHGLVNVLLIFASAYGNTAAIADALANGISRTGICVQSINCEFASSHELLDGIRKADAYIIGSPTLGGHAPTPIISALGTLLAEGDKKKPVGVFGSYGWSGEALDLLENKLRDGGFAFGFEAIKVKFTPDALMVKKLEETGTIFGRDLLQAKNRHQRKVSGGLNASRSDPAMLALGRIVGSLCVLTTSKGELDNKISGAMVASWVSQASFSPPGLSISVSKDRAVESLLHCGDKFTLNVLAAGRHNKLMKQFLQPFPPGADRLTGLQLETSPAGQPILPEALAWLEGCVEQRMECGDHWLIYAQIHHGKVLDAQGVTAIHHRRTGANY